MRQVLFGDAVAGVADLDVDRLGHQEFGVGAVRDARRDEDRAALGHGLLGVQHQVQQHLLDLIGRGDDRRQRRLEVVFDAHAVLAQVLFDQALGLLDEAD